MQAMCWTFVVKTEPSLKPKPSTYQLICGSTLAGGHELRAVTERMRSGIQTAELRFLCRAAGFSLTVQTSLTLNEPVQVVWPTDYVPLEVFSGW